MGRSGMNPGAKRRANAYVLIAMAVSACGHGVDRVHVEGGAYSVGCSERPLCDSNQPRSVQIGTFEIDKTLVTVSEYRACVEKGACPALDQWNSIGWLSPDPEEIVGVVPRLANAFCKYRGGRLPSNAEWELATRGPNRNVYPWGNRWDDSKLIANRRWRPSGHTCLSYLYRAAGTRPDVHSYFGVEDTTGAGPEYVSDDGKRVQLRGCGNPSRRRAYDEDCKLARVKEPPLNVYAAFRCVYLR